MSDLKFDVIKELGTLSETQNGWKKEVKIISWNNRKPKLDIREWDETGDKMSKGITLHADEVEKLKEILADLDVKLLGGE